jgi:cob(I)alamin adenosyltransferase
MSRVRKTSARVAAYGDVDELNSVVGVVRARSLPEDGDARLAAIQNDLFDLGADLSVPSGEAEGTRLRVSPDQVARLERWCDEGNERLDALTSFVLPAGTQAAAALHHARTVCRRAERSVVALADEEPVNPQAIAYLNRLSDLLFILARGANAEEGDVLWVPGGPDAGT